MQKIAIIACLITFAPLWAENEQDVQSFLSYEEWREITGSSQDKEDCIVLVDGKRISGTIAKLPSLTYNFVKMEFDPAEIKTVAVVKLQNDVKIQYITREGQNYIGKLAEGKFVFWVSEPSLKDPSHMAEKELEPKFVNFIVLANRESKTPHTNPQLGSLELNNGDHIPIAIMSNPILLTDGWSDKRIKAEDVLELCFDGGVHGKILDNGAETNLGFMYAKDQYILIQIPRNQYLVKLPWSQISYIQGYNGGFRQQKLGRELFNPTYFQDDTTLDEIGTMLIGHQNINPDCLGIEKGELLNGALCSSPISSKAIAELDQLGIESLIAMEQLFDPSEEGEWLAEIEMEEFADVHHLVAIMEEAMLDDLAIIIASEELLRKETSMDLLTEMNLEEFDLSESSEENMTIAFDHEFDMDQDIIELKDSEWTLDILFDENEVVSVEEERKPEEVMSMILDNEFEIYDGLTEINDPELTLDIVFDKNEAVSVEEESKPEEVMSMILDDEFEIYDGLTPVKDPELTLDIAIDENEKEKPKEKEEPKTLIGIDEIVIDHEDLDGEITEDILWAEKEANDGNLNLTPQESLFIEEFLTGETPAEQPLIWKKTHHVR